MESVIINLRDLVKPPFTDSISGREFGEEHARDKKILDLMAKNKKIIIVIDDTIKAINDSFIKGFFSAVFEKYKKKDVVKNYFEINANSYFIKLFDKNWSILESINNV